MTTAQDSRAQFEAGFPVPSGVSWNGVEYVVADDYLNSYRVNVFIGQWAAWQASRAALSAEPVAVPQGWKLVPVEPSEEMFVEGMEADCLGRPSVDDDRHVRSIWSAMLAAAPQPAAQGPVAVVTGTRTDYQPDGQATHSATIQALHPADLKCGDPLYGTGRNP